MHPILFEIPFVDLKVHVYGLMYALGFLFGYLWVRRESVRLSLDPERMGDLLFYILIAGTIGSRLFYVVVEAPEFLRDPLEIFKIWNGGLVYYGGLIGALVIAIAYCVRHRMSFFRVGDLFAPGLALGHAFGRIGCFFAGCCYGGLCEAKAWYAVYFPEIAGGIAPPHLPLYPTQLMESAGNFLIFLVLVLMRRKKSFDGQIFLFYVLAYALMRSGIEVLRGDVERGYVVDGVLSTSQFISGLAIIGVIGLWVWRVRKRSQQSS